MNTKTCECGICKKCKHREHQIKWYHKNIERGREINKKSQAKDINAPERKHRWYNLNKERLLKKRKQNYIDNKTTIKTKRRKIKSEERGLGFVPLNEPFDGCSMHHLDRDHILYIPLELHNSTMHRQDRPETMDMVNEKVINWYVDYYGLI